MAIQPHDTKRHPFAVSASSHQKEDYKKYQHAFALGCGHRRRVSLSLGRATRSPTPPKNRAERKVKGEDSKQERL